MPKKASLLKDMKIHEVSLVREPASPGADVLFTKARDVSEEPRDDHGRWTAAQAAMRGGVQALHNHAKALAGRVVRSQLVRTGVGGVHAAAYATSHTKPTAVHPVEGGGVQFSFEHPFPNGGAMRTHVQVRSEHVSSLPTRAGWALQRFHDLLAASGFPQQKSFAGAPAEESSGVLSSAANKLATIFRAQHVTPYQVTQERRNLDYQRSLDAQRARMGLAPMTTSPGIGTAARNLFPDIQSAMSTVSGSGASLATREGARAVIDNTADLQRTERSLTDPEAQGSGKWGRNPDLHGFPTFEPAAYRSVWATTVEHSRQENPDYGRIQEIAGKDYIKPMEAGSASTASGWAFTTPEGHFIPAMSPEYQHQVERVQQWLSTATPGQRSEALLRMGKGNVKPGQAYFSGDREFVPAHNNPLFQSAVERAYAHENEREEMLDAVRANEVPANSEGTVIHEYKSSHQYKPISAFGNPGGLPRDAVAKLFS